MLVLDTNVLSELMKSDPATNVLTWIDDQPARSLFISTVTKAEILHGILLLPKGRRQTALASAAREMFTKDFEGRLLSFDSLAAEAYAEIVVARRHQGQPISNFDAQIAAITRSTGATLATRNTADFDNCGVDLINPWDY